MLSLPENLYTAAQTRELDARAMQAYGLGDGQLMERAGLAAFELLRSRWPRARRLGILCGPGNNGGDGYVLARHAQAAGLTPHIWTVGDPSALKGDAERARRRCEEVGVQAQAFTSTALQQVELIVDSLLGTGLERELTGAWRAAVEAVNASPVPVLALDLPSGLHADTGQVLGVAVQAQASLCFIGLKAGLFTGEGRSCAGDIFFDDLGVPAAVYAEMIPRARRLLPEKLTGRLAHRLGNTHKGRYGHVLVVGGQVGMGGAAHLAGEAAYRSGAGLVSLATHSTHATAISAARPELMAQGVQEAADVQRLASRAQVLAVGPGLGQGPWGQALWNGVLELDLPLVVDADALNLLAQSPQRRDHWVLTPHPGEAARLLGCSVAAIQADRFSAAQNLADRYGGVCVLKGAGTVLALAGEQSLAVCDRGNPGMAVGGMGDVLTGVIAALLAQGLNPWDAACLGVWGHACAGDLCAHRSGELGLLASDLMPYLGACLESPR